MLEAKLFFLTEVKGQNVQISEKIGNFFLRPAQYLWKGKKIDFVQSGTNFASQHDLIYQPYQRTWLKAVLMVIALIPGTIIGSIFKGYATLRYHNPQYDLQFKKCITGVPNKFISEDQVFLNFLNSFVKKVRPNSDSGFISEIRVVHLEREYNKIRTQNNTGWSSTNNFRIERLADLVSHNSSILAHIHLLHNLSIVDVSDHYKEQAPCKEELKIRQALLARTPTIYYDHDTNSSHSKQHTSARAFYNLQNPLNNER